MRTHKPLINPVYDTKNFYRTNNQPSTQITRAISAVSAQTAKLPHVEKGEILSTSTIHNDVLKPLAKQIDLVLKEMNGVIKNMESSNASLRPSGKECTKLYKNIRQLKDGIVKYKETALDITSYKHNKKKTDKLNSLIKESIQLEYKLNKNLNKSKNLQEKVANELNKSAREMEERTTRKNDIQNNR